MKNKLYTLVAFLVLATPAWAAWTERYVDAAAAGGGDGTTAATSGGTGAWTLAEAIAAASAGQRVNIKAGTYANTTTSLTFAVDGTAGSPIWWRGYNTTIGDIDSNNALTKPSITFTTGQFISTGAYNWFYNLDISGAATTSSQGQVYINDVDNMLVRCRFTDTAANSAARALTTGSGSAGSQIVACYFTANTTSTYVVYLGGGSNTLFGCFVDGGAIGVALNGAGEMVSHCIFDDQSSHAISVASGTVAPLISNNTIYSSGGAGVNFAAAADGCVVANNLFDSVATYGVNSPAGTNASILCVNNAYYNPGTAQVGGIIEDHQIGAITEADSPLVNPGSNDFSIESDSGSKAGAFPGTFENLSQTGYLDAGAVQRQESGSAVAIDPIQLSQ